MKLNKNKCHVMTISAPGKNIVNYDYNFHPGTENNLHRVETTKDLGVIFDSNLQFKEHIQAKIATARKMLGIIYRSFDNLNQHTFILLYKSFVRSHLEYGSCIWNPYKIGMIKDLEKVQKRATKLACKNKALTYSERLKVLNLPTLKYRRHRGDMIEVFKILKGFYDKMATPNVELSSNVHTRGNSFKLKVSYKRLNVAKYSFCNRVVSVWNSLPDFVVSSSSILAFKVNLDKAWSQEGFLFDPDANIPGSTL